MSARSQVKHETIGALPAWFPRGTGVSTPCRSLQNLLENDNNSVEEVGTLSALPRLARAVQMCT